jgi:hypothetical protein
MSCPPNIESRTVQPAASRSRPSYVGMHVTKDIKLQTVEDTRNVKLDLKETEYENVDWFNVHGTVHR